MAKQNLYNFLGSCKNFPIDDKNFKEFIENLRNYFIDIEHVSSDRNEEVCLKGIFKDYLLKVYDTKKDCRIWTEKDRVDLTILKNYKPCVIFEFKSPKNKSEMIQLNDSDINKKALRQAIYYFYNRDKLEEIVDIKNIVITDGEHVFIFKQNSFLNPILRNLAPKLKGLSTDIAYDLIKEKIVDRNIQFDYTEFDLIKFKQHILEEKLTSDDRRQLGYLYKALHPNFLLQEYSTKDVNVLNPNFYDELLYIMGLKEIKVKNKITIIRDLETKNTFLDIVYNKLKDEKPDIVSDNEREEIALELVITWINRVLFIKLFESQLIAFNNNDEENFKILDSEKIITFSDLNALFIQVLNKRIENRYTEYKHYSYIPYLNSSLFELTDTEEKKAFPISSIQNKTLTIKSNSCLKNTIESKTPYLLEYLLKFLSHYIFSAEKKDDLLIKGKDIINASVLGLIFEKINGHKDGAVYTPSTVTEYMAERAIKNTFIKKFNETYNTKYESYDDIKFEIQDKFRGFEKRKEISDLINSLKICDPAVGSGHFLVSVLNQLIKLKSDLGCIFISNSNNLLVDYDISIENDSLVLYDMNGKQFEYDRNSKLSQQVQQTLFQEKRTIIENSLFGVDINPKSVQICCLRLWIELLKNAYYKLDGTMETLPNIDINIKCGNSLISKIPYEVNKNKLSDVDEHLAKDINYYKEAVKNYKKTSDKEYKRKINVSIKEIQSKIEGKFYEQLQLLFDGNITAKNNDNENEIYKGSLEWAIAFPELLNNNGKFLGFDLIIGNPPYISAREDNDQNTRNYVNAHYKLIKDMWDLYVPFIELGLNLLKKNGYLSMIIPSTIGIVDYTENLVDYIENNCFLKQIDFFPNSNLFKGVSVKNKIILIENQKSSKNKMKTLRLKHYKNFYDIEELDIRNDLSKYKINTSLFNINKKNTLKLSDICFVSYGLRLNSDKNDKEYSFKKSDLVSETCNDINNRAYIEGKYIDRYKINKILYVEWNTPRCPFRLVRPTFSELYDTKRILLSRQKRIATYTEKNFICDNTIIMAILAKDLSTVYNRNIDKYYKNLGVSRKKIEENSFQYELKYLLAILNSKLISYYIRCNERGEIDFYPDDWKNIPIVNTTTDIQYKLSEKVSELLELNNKLGNFNEKNIQNDEIKNIKNNIKLLDSEIDLYVYKLYNLTYDEILVVDKDFSMMEEEYSNYKL